MNRFASRGDKCLMFWGTLGAMANGAALPMFSLIFGELVDAFNQPCDAGQSADDCYQERVDGVAYWYIITFINSKEEEL
jgi:hypothetical protein